MSIRLFLHVFRIVLWLLYSQSLSLYSTFCCRTVVMLTSHLDRKERCPFTEPHASPGASIISGVRAKGFTMRQVNVESYTISKGSSCASALGIGPQAHKNLTTRISWIIPCWRHLDDLTVH
jgi:hypothetical protein